MSASLSGMRGGQPSTTQPIAGPWLSPKVVTRNKCPNVLYDMGDVDHLLRSTHGMLPLPWGEGWGEGLRPIESQEPPHPNPLPCGEREPAELLAPLLLRVKWPSNQL